MKTWMLVFAVFSFMLNVIGLAAVYFDAALLAEFGKINFLFWLLVIDTIIETPVVALAVKQYLEYQKFVADAVKAAREKQTEAKS